MGTDYSSRSDSFTLNLWDGKKLNEISEDVYDYTVMFNGDILYLYDYSTSKYEGELCPAPPPITSITDTDLTNP